VRMVIQKDYSPTTQPDNINYLSTIKVLSSELRRPITTNWVRRRHEGNAWNKTNSESQPIDEVKDLATQCHQNKKTKSRSAIAHIQSTQMSISILHTRFFGELNDSLKYPVNGGYLHGYTQSKHKWSDKVWDMMDMTAFGKFFKSISLNHQPAHVKFIQN
jgi:hypothetical protein